MYINCLRTCLCTEKDLDEKNYSNGVQLGAEKVTTCPLLYRRACILNKIINAPCGTLKLLLALGVAKYIKSYKIHFVVQYATDYCPLEHDNYKTISAHLGSPISCNINNLHGACIFLLSVYLTYVFSRGRLF